jgi:hypothetical protein
MSQKRHARCWVVESLPFSGKLGELVSAVEQASFDDEELARQECRRLERERRQTVNPFRVSQGALAALTSLEPAIFRDWLLDASVVPPDLTDRTDWVGWYDGCQARWDDAQRERFWEALDLLRFHRVVERPTRRGYVVMEIGWLWCDEPPYYTDPECRQAVEVFANRSEAERRRRELERQRRSEWPAHVEFSWQTSHGETADAPFYEVVEVEWEGPP